MSDFILPDYTPRYPISKSVKPRQRTAKLPDWGTEQRATVGQNQTSPEWSVKWILLPADADILDEFLAERARRGEWFLWTPPGGTLGRYRCDDWTKSLPNCTWRELQATFRQVYSYELPSVSVRVGTYLLFGSTSFARGYILRPLLGEFLLAGGAPALAETLPFYVGTGALQLAGGQPLLARNLPLTAGVGGFALVGTDTAFLYFSLSSTYHADLASQVWGWDRDFQVDWWGD